MSSKTSINSRIERGDFEVFPFQADVVKLLNHLVNTFCKNKDFFLRELLQNSADALDKLSTLTQGQPMYNERSSRGDCSSVGGKELCIHIIPDIQQKTLTIVDNGIGMTKREILSNLAGMTKSCIRSHSEKLRYSLALNDVEQCGVGFYSAYLVADKVTVYTKHCNDKAFVWESVGNGEFTLKVDIRNTTKRGTHVVLQMKPECMGYLDEINLITIGKTHSKHISYPVYFKMAKDRLIGIDTPIGFALPEQVIKTEQVQEYRNGLWRASRTQRKVFYYDIVHLNTSPQIWLREPYTATSDAYGEFYRALTNDPEPHRAVIHFEMEKPVKFHALFFIPQRAPANFMENARQQPNVKFYIGHEFYSDNLSDLLLPDFLCFLRGVIDCGQFIEEDGHEMQYIRSSVAHKTLEMLAELKQNTEEYLGFFEEFGKYLKLGIIENEPLRDPLMNLLLFKTSFDSEHFCSLNDYVNRRKAKQPGIYCLNEVSLKRAVDSPFTEQVEAFQFEVVYMLEPLDEFALPLMRSYRGIPMIQCNKEELPLPSSRSNEMRRIAERGRFRPLCALMQEILDWRIEKVVVSKRLCSSPSCVVTTAYGLTPGIQSTIAAQALANYCPPMMTKHNGDGLVLEINPNCKLMQAMSKLCQKGDYEVVNYVFLLFDLSLLVSGYTLTQPAIYDLRVQRLIEKLLGIELEYDAQEFIDLTMSMEAKA